MNLMQAKIEILSTYDEEDRQECRVIIPEGKSLYGVIVANFELNGTIWNNIYIPELNQVMVTGILQSSHA
jgi:hypothetical protein